MTAAGVAAQTARAERGRWWTSADVLERMTLSFGSNTGAETGSGDGVSLEVIAGRFTHLAVGWRGRISGTGFRGDGHGRSFARVGTLTAATAAEEEKKTS